jgi:hypothetical protein
MIPRVSIVGNPLLPVWYCNSERCEKWGTSFIFPDILCFWYIKHIIHGSWVCAKSFIWCCVRCLTDRERITLSGFTVVEHFLMTYSVLLLTVTFWKCIYSEHTCYCQDKQSTSMTLMVAVEIKPVSIVLY